MGFSRFTKSVFEFLSDLVSIWIPIILTLSHTYANLGLSTLFIRYSITSSPFFPFLSNNRHFNWLLTSSCLSYFLCSDTSCRNRVLDRIDLPMFWTSLINDLLSPRRPMIDCGCWTSTLITVNYLSFWSSSPINLLSLSSIWSNSPDLAPLTPNNYWRLIA